MNFTAHKEKDNKKMSSYINGWRDKKGRDELKGKIFGKKYRSEVRQVTCIKRQ